MAISWLLLLYKEADDMRHVSSLNVLRSNAKVF